MEIHFQIKLQKNRFTKNYNDWIIICYLTDNDPILTKGMKKCPKFHNDLIITVI